ncbi:MAG TPA: alpha/beta hydrolase [Marmoricola sp.]|nr:alpha/beta hydrolase [Marmoricola sp.]
MSTTRDVPMHTVDLTAGTVHYREAGPVDGRPVVFVHGFLVDHALWSDVPERLAADGFHTFAPTWPLGAQTTAMDPSTALSPRDVARIVLQFLGELDLDDVVLVGNDTGGAICQFVIDEDASRIGRLVLTNCDAFETFPPFPFNLLFRLGRHPAATRAVMQGMRPAWLRNGVLGFGRLAKRPLSGEETLGWVLPYLDQKAVRDDTARFLRGWRPGDLADVATRLDRFDRPVLLAWAPEDRFFRLSLAERLLDVFPDARLVEVPDARTFVALDQPAVLARHIADFASS